jgi:GNAT superfamily N-acetyltransferase
MHEVFYVRPIEVGDYPRVSEIICRCLREVNIRDYSDEHISKMLPVFAPDNLPKRFEGADTVVLVTGRQIVGTATLRGEEIQSVFVDPQKHGKGYGRQLMVHLERQAVMRGFSGVSLNSSLTSQGFYQHLGYVPISKMQGEVGGLMIKMRKDLQPPSKK